MKRKFTLGILALTLLIVACNKNDEPINVNVPEDTPEDTLFEQLNLSGFVQKGPFINGTEITMFELTEDMIQTGRTFSTQINDNTGGYTFSPLYLYSPLVELKASGFYFNEVTGEKSLSPITLYAITDLTDKSGLNINVISHLERQRIKYLIGQGTNFADAKKQAQKEVLDIFNLGRDDMPESEKLDISKTGDENSILLAISSILQGFRTEADLAELLANISTDIREDGILDDEKLGSELVNYTSYLRPSIIRENLKNRYVDLGLEVTISDFEKNIQTFLDSTTFAITKFIEYPQFTSYGANILSDSITSVKKDKFYSMGATLSKGMHLKIIISGGLWYYRLSPNGPKNFSISTYEDEKQVFELIEDNTECDLPIQFTIPPYDENGNRNKATSDTVKIEFFENYSPIPTKVKDIIIQ